MPLVIIDAADVRDGEPRRWFPSAESAGNWLATRTFEHDWKRVCHTRTREAHNIADWTHAIVDRPSAPPPPQSPAPVDEPPVDIKAARAWAGRVLREMSDEEDDADLWPIARVILACTPPDLAAAIAALPVVGDEGRGGAVDLESVREALAYHLDPYEWTAEHMDEQHWQAVATMMPAAPALLARVRELEAEIATLRAALANAAEIIEHECPDDVAEPFRTLLTATTPREG